MSIWQIQAHSRSRLPSQNKTGKRQNKNQGMLGDSSKSWGVPRLNPLHNSCIPIWAEPLCFLSTPLPSSTFDRRDAVKTLVSVTPAALTVLLLQFLIGKTRLCWLGRGKKATNELKTEHRPRRRDITSEVSKSLRSHPSILLLKGDCCSTIEMDRNVWSYYPMSAVQQLPTERCQKAEVGDQSSARPRKETISSFTDHICPSGNISPHPSNKMWNNCTQISVETGVSTSPKISNTWEWEKHQSQTAEMRSFKH